MAKRRYRLAVLASHPIQYQAPLWRSLAAHPQLDLTVYFYSRHALDVALDPGFGQAFTWDIPLLEGYSHQFLRNYSPRPRVGTFWGAFHPSLAVELSPARYDAVLVHGWYSLSNWLAFTTTGLRRLPVLLRATATPRSLRRGRAGLKRFLLPRLFRRVAGFLSTGTENHAFYREVGVAPERIFFVPYAVDNNFFQRRGRALRPQASRLRHEYGIPEHAVVVLFVGKLIALKRPHDLLEAARRLCAPELALVFVGDGPLRASVQDTAHRYHLRNIFFPGFQNQSRLPAFYALADAIALPSESETWGLVLNEAMNFALPVLASEGVTAATDLVESGGNGWVFPTADVNALSRYLEVLLHDPDRRLRMGQRSAEIIRRWSYLEDAEGILAALQVVLRRSPLASAA
ncbi:MAG: glycosyltransferase family 4 protein [Terriglobia bacterium]